MQITTAKSALLNPALAKDATTSSATNAATTGNNILNQGDFLKLLVAQMTAQDPMHPQSNTEFAAQMAQFSALQTSQATEADLVQLQANQHVQQANDLIGRTVTLQNSNGSAVSGMVSAVQMYSNSPYLVVNGALYDLSQVVTVAPGVATGSPAPTVPKHPVPK
jgi:flagellar basal-body rod modification protein FlgD